MKNSVIILGVALVSFSNICNAKNTVNLPYKSFQNIILSDDIEIKTNNTVKYENRSLTEDAEIFNPETVITANPKTIKEIIFEGDKIVENTFSDDLDFITYEKSMKKIVAQSDLITENAISNITYPLYIERTLADEITEMELIIESTVTNEAKSLDFKKINSNSVIVNSISTKKFLGMN